MSEQTRRGILATLGGTVVVGLAGCQGGGDWETTTDSSSDAPGGVTATAGSTATAGDQRTNTGTDGTETTTEPEPGILRVAHMSPDAPNVDVYLDGDPVIEDVAFQGVSDYLTVPAGTRAVEITAAGERNTVVFEGEIEVAPATSYTITALGELTGGSTDFEPTMLEDDNSEVGSDSARIRLVHASPDAPAVDVTTASTGNAIVDGAAFGEGASVEVPAGEYTLQIRGDTASNDGDVVSEYAVELAGGTVYTAFATGYLSPTDDDGDAPFDLSLSVDAGSGGGGLLEPPRIQFAHMSPDAPDVDVLVDDEELIGELPFRQASEYVELLAGERQTIVRDADNPTIIAFGEDLTYEAGTDYTLVATGEVLSEDTPFRVLQLTDNTTNPGSDSARVRLLHAAPDVQGVDVTLASSGEAIADGLSFNEHVTTTVPAGEYTLQIRRDTPANDGAVLGEYDVSLSGSTVYTAIAAGFRTPDDEASSDAGFDLTLVEGESY